MLAIKKQLDCIFLLVLALSIHQSVSARQDNRIENVELPADWNIQKVITVPKDNLGAFSERLGGELVTIQNYILDVRGIMLRVNVAEAKTEKDAQHIYQAFLSLHKTEKECLLKGPKVFEFISTSTQLIEMAHALFSGKSAMSERMMENLDQMIWEAKIILAPIEKADYMAANDMFNLLRSYRGNADNPETRSKILDLKKRFTFSDVIHLRYEDPPWGAPEYSLGDVKKTSREGDIITYTLDNPQTRLGIPLIEISAKIPVKASSYYQPAHKIDNGRLTAATPYWPVRDREIVQLLETIIKEGMTPEQKIGTIHQWISKNLKYGGKVVGSRYGIGRVLEQNYGRCWDFCDVFTTLCRAAKIPSRQVMGWIYGKSGHVWAEYYIPEKGWCSIDPSTPFSGVTTDYVPFFISEGGELPALYWEEPHLEAIDTNR